MRLLISQKDQVFKRIQDHNLFVPSQFDLLEFGERDIYTQIVYKGTDYSFMCFKSSSSRYTVNHQPGEREYQEVIGVNLWAEIILQFDIWLDCLQREIQAPNYWSRLNSQLSTIKLSDKETHDKFTYMEFIEMSEKVDSIIKQISELSSIQEVQLVEIKSQLTHLVSLAKKLNRFDWKNLFIGTIVNLLAGFEITKDAANEIWIIIQQTFKGYFLDK